MKFFKSVSQTIKRDLEKNPPKVLERFHAKAKARKYLPIAIGMETQPTKYRFICKEMLILQRSSFGQKMEYIHYNPVAAGLCAYPEDYKYSSILLQNLRKWKP